MKQKVQVEIKQTFTYYKEYEIEIDKEKDYDELLNSSELKDLVFKENLDPLDTGICSTEWDVIPQ